MSSVNSADKEKVFAVYLVVFLLSAFWSGSFSKLSCKEKSWSEKSTFSFTGFLKWQFLETLLQRKKLEWKINFFFYWLFEVAVSRNSPAKKKVGVGNQLFLLLAFESGNFSKLPYTLSDWPVRGKPHVKCAACLGHTDSTYSTESTRFGKCPSAQSTSGFRGKPKVANSRKLGGKFSKVGWQILESWVANSRKLLKVLKTCWI